jgi:hypothetical protein
MKSFIFITFYLYVCLTAHAQVPQTFNYQGLARDNAGNALSNQNIMLKASILEESSTGIPLYSEMHNINTNAFGLFSLGIGSGSISTGNFSAIRWSTGNKFLKIEIDPTGGNNFTLSNTTQLLSVPYSLNAATVSNESQTLTLNGKNLSISQGNSVDLSPLLPNPYESWSKVGNNCILDSLITNVGIGVSSPSAQFHTNGTLRFQGLNTDNNLEKVLVTDTSGNVFTRDFSSFENSQWTNVSGGISYIDGKVGIGTSTPFVPLNIEGIFSGFDRNPIELYNKSTAQDGICGIGLQVNENSVQDRGFLQMVSSNYYPTKLQYLSGRLVLSSVSKNGIRIDAGNKNTANIELAVGTDGSKVLTRMIISNSGNIGIGTTSPKSMLHVASGDVYIEDATKGIIMKNSLGQCYRVTIGTTGTLSSTLITCP